MKKEKRLITSALTYVNNIPHVGHIVGCHLPADIFARYCRSFGYDTTFVGGSDMHGTPSVVTAQEVGVPVEELTEKLHLVHKKIYEKLGISYDIYSNTHTKTHEKITSEFFLELYKNGFISEGEIEMYYCEKDKMFLPDRFVVGTCPNCGYTEANGDQCEKCDSIFSLSELKDAHCKICGEKAVLKKSKHIFLILSKGVGELDKWIESKKDIWRPHVYSEAKKWVQEGLKDRCISRDIKWGFPVPLKGYEDKVFYVWFDAPIGYISITRELSEQKYEDLWLKKGSKIYNFVGKDNIQFHTVFFPTMLLENKKYNLAYNMVGLNFLNYEGKKFSKSKKIGVFCNSLLDEKSDIDIDTFRAYLTTIIPENRDTDYKWEDYKNNTNSELVGKFGNLFNRTLNMVKNYFNGENDFELTKDIVLNDLDKDILSAITTMPERISQAYEKAELREAYKLIMNFATLGNGYIESSAPWALMKQEKFEEAKKVLFFALNICASLCIVASPIIPNKVKSLWQDQLGLSDDPTSNDFWENASRLNIKKGHKIKEINPIFERVDDEKLQRFRATLSTPFDIKEYIDSTR
ncbi:MAG: methionine--tRNA ligase [Clostridia bacterium]|nr:methionine--tRNA ligase [Clostridia bacterium]